MREGGREGGRERKGREGREGGREAESHGQEQACTLYMYMYMYCIYNVHVLHIETESHVVHVHD